MNIKVYLDIPYNEKDEAKALYARWDPKEKKWYYKGDIKYLYKFGKWILNKNREVLIALDSIYLFEGKQRCWKCNKYTTVIGLGIGNNICFYESMPGEFSYGYSPKGIVFLSWVNSEKDIPDKLLKYMKTKYKVHSTTTKAGGKCFANHCEHCGAVQGNNYIFNESDTVFEPLPFDKSLYQKRLQDINLYQIPIDESMLLNWNYYISNVSEDYLKFCNKSVLNLL